MKQKYKSPEKMQELGVTFHTKILKKTVKAMIAVEEKTIEPFFYNTEFEFEEETHPALYIGELPSKWKTYLKEKKKDDTFAHGECLIDDNGLLKFRVDSGKGGKDIALKKINKVLLKPFCQAYLVEDLNTEVAPLNESEETTAPPSDTSAPTESEDVQVEDKEQNDDALDNWISASKSFLKDANQSIKDNLKILADFEKPLSKLRDIVVTDDFIAEAMKAKTKIVDLDPLVLQLKSMNKSGETHKGKSKEADGLLSLLLKQIKQIESNKSKIDLMIKNMEGLKNISDPKDSEIPIIEDNPFVNFLNRTKKAYN